MKRLCGCGCGTIVTNLRFVRGHNLRSSMRLQGRERWRGDNYYYSTHKWLATHHEKAGACSKCGKEGKTDWANISGEYKRDIADYVELCRSCHVRMDLEKKEAAA